MSADKKPAALKFIQAMRSFPTPKPKVNVVDAKRLAMAMQKIGKTVTGVEARPDGSIAVSVTDPAVPQTPTNEWDEVLKP